MCHGAVEVRTDAKLCVDLEYTPCNDDPDDPTTRRPDDPTTRRLDDPTTYARYNAAPQCSPEPRAVKQSSIPGLIRPSETSSW